ncbi:MAG: hypothetical protein WAW61_19530 [Methylococcaceae bacterium]
MIEPVALSQDRIYILNRQGAKLLQLRLKNEPNTTEVSYCQIKIIPYKIRHALIYRDMPDDPWKVNISEDVELTYHGGRKIDAMPKIQLKVATNVKHRYKTLVDSTLSLESSLPHPAPILTLETGHSFGWEGTEEPKKRSHKYNADYNEPTRIDFYLSGGGMNFQDFVDSTYFLNLFFTPEYLCATKCHPLQGGLIVSPITVYPSGEYSLWVRESISCYRGRPYLQFYSNSNYYNKFTNRRKAWLGFDGKLTWSSFVD